MTGPDGSDAVAPPAWYREWFGSAYLELYPHRDQEEARRAVRLFSDRSRLAPGSLVLDLACGAGRHLRALDARGFRTVGIDLSSHLLDAARTSHQGARLIRADMRRLPLGAGSVAAVTSFFTSFGYFESEGDDRRVLLEVKRLLEPGGIFLLDFLNADMVRASLRPRDRREAGGREVIQERRLIEDGRRVEKRIQLRPLDEPDATPRRFRERVRLYSAEELSILLDESGFEVWLRFGDYDGGPLGPDSPRAILMARAL